MTNAFPVLLSLDPAATVRFYESKLGFHCRYQQEWMAILVRDPSVWHSATNPLATTLATLSGGGFSA